MSDANAFVPESAGAELPGSLLPLWHKPQVSRISIASSDAARPRLRPTADDFVS
jgi:hypothetical protein